MCNSEQNIELNLCQILERINQCCLNNEELNSIRQQIESVQTWINSFEADLTTNSVVLSEAIDVFPINTPIQVVLEYLYETLQTITPSNKQEAIQFKEGGVNLGTSGTVDNINFIGDVEVTRIGDALTVNVVGSATDLTVANRTATTLDVTSSSGNDAAIPSATTSLAGLISAADKTKLDGIQTGAEANVQSDWNVLDNTSDAFILNKPTIPSITGLAPISYVDNQDALKQDLLVSGTNIKTINGNSLLGSGNLTIAGGGGGETNTASNVGVAGVGIFKQKTGVDLEFKKLNAGSNKITITDDVANNEVDVDVVVANLTGIAQSQITNLTTDLSNKQETLVSGTNIKTINSTSLLGSGNINIDLSVKQTNIQFQDEGVSLGTSGTVDVINFTGASITASRTGNTVTIDVTGGGGGGATNLAYNASPTNGVVTSDTGTDATIPLADGTNAGLLAPAQFTKLSNISITQPIDLDQLESDTTTNNAKVSNATHTGDVSGSTILTLATVNSNVGTFGSGTQIPQFVVNGKGLITSVSNVTITPAASSITGAGNITKVDDTNVTLTLGGTPTGSVLNSVSFTLGWTGTLADGRIASASNWNSAYTNRITSLTTTGNSGASTLISNVLNIPNYTLAGLGGISLTSLSSTATGLTYTNTTGVFSLTSGYVIPTTTQETNWNTAYTNRITSLTTTGSSGAATLISNVLNIPTYTLAGLGGQPLDADLTAIAALTGTSGFLKTNGAGTWTVDTNTYLTGNQSITLSGEASGSGTTGISVTLSNSAVIGKVLTGFTSTTGTILATDSILQAIQKLDGNLAAATAGGVSSVTGTTNRITSTGGSNPIIDISASYVGQSSITTLGTITTGVWNGTAIGDTYISSATTWNNKQAGIQFKEEGSNLGTSNTVTEINFTGGAITASRVGNIITVDVPSTAGVTNLGYTTSATNGIVTSDTGTDATILAASGTIAGLMLPADFTKLSYITITQAVDLDALEADVADLTTLSGVASNATTLGTFTGTTIPDSSTVKAALQSLETATEANFTTNNRQYKIRVVSVSTSISATTDGTVVFDTASTVATLPSPTNELMLVVMNASAGNITVTGHINGVAAQTFTISSLESYKFHSNGSTFYII